MVKTLRDKSREETRAKLVDAASIEFAKHGVQGARIMDIAKAAGVAAGTFYIHFKDKEDIFAEVMKVGSATMLEGLRTTLGIHDGDARDRAAMEGVVVFAEANGALFRLLMSRAGSEDPLQRGVIDAIAAQRAEELRKRQSEGKLRPDFQPEMAARCEVGVIFHLLDWWLSDTSKAPRETIITTLMSFRRYGVEGEGGGWKSPPATD